MDAERIEKENETGIKVFDDSNEMREMYQLLSLSKLANDEKTTLAGDLGPVLERQLGAIRAAANAIKNDPFYQRTYGYNMAGIMRLAKYFEKKSFESAANDRDATHLSGLVERAKQANGDSAKVTNKW